MIENYTINSTHIQFSVRSISHNHYRAALFRELGDYLAKTRNYELTKKLTDLVAQDKTHHVYFTRLSKYFSPYIHFYKKTDHRESISFQVNSKKLSDVRDAYQENISRYLDAADYNRQYYTENTIFSAAEKMLNSELSVEEAVTLCDEIQTSIRKLDNELHEVKELLNEKIQDNKK